MSGSPPVGRPDLHRLRVRFGKDGRLAYLGHLEVAGTIERSVRRSALPFSVGNGFARRMRIQFSQALPVGSASACEYYDLYLTERVAPREALERLVTSTPASLAPTAASYVRGRLPALEAWLTRSAWRLELSGTGGAFAPPAFDAALRELRAIGAISFMRGDRPRTIGLDDTLVSWAVTPRQGRGGCSVVDLVLDTRSSNLGALRPAVLVEAALSRPVLAAVELDSMRVLRVAQWHEGADGSLVDALSDGVTMPDPPAKR